MRLAFRKSSRSLFTAAAAVALGLQLAPWPSVSAQDGAPAPLAVQTQARPISQKRVERKQQFNNTQLPPAQQPVPPAPVSNSGQSEVQRELQKLYEQNGRVAPEMIDVRQSMGNPPQNSASQAQQYQPQPALASQPQYQQPMQAQPVAQSTPQPAAAPAPKKKGLLSKWFHREDNSGPTQPPVEPPYTPPLSTGASAAPQQFVQQPAQAQPLAQPSSNRPNYGFLFEDEGGAAPLQQVPQQQIVARPVQAPIPVQTQTPVEIPQLAPVTPITPAGNSDGFEAPLFVETPAQTPAQSGIPSLDFNAPIQDPANEQIELGEAAPLNAPMLPVAAAPARPADPFSDEALFPSEAPAPAVAQPAVIAEAPVAPQQPSGLQLPVLTEESAASETLSVEPTPPAEESFAADTAGEAENPYSGLTLDTEPVSTAAVVKAVAPAPIETPSLGNTTRTNSLDHEVTPDLVAPPRELASTSVDSEPPLLVDPADPVPGKLAPIPRPGSERTQAKMEMIAARKGLRGLKGFCPVALRDHRDLVDAQSQYRVVYNEKTYYLASSEAVSAFHSDPAKYAPAARGSDVIHLAITGEELEGSLDHAVWYKGRLYLFSSVETMETFVAAPSSHATLD